MPETAVDDRKAGTAQAPAFLVCAPWARSNG